jgi:hypothetical protein
MIHPTGLGASDLAYSTYIGSNELVGTGVAVDPWGGAYLIGYTSYNTYPTTTGAFQSGNDGMWNSFITKFDASNFGMAFPTPSNTMTVNPSFTSTFTVTMTPTSTTTPLNTPTFTPTPTPVGAVVIGNQAVNGGYNDLALKMGVSGSERFTSRATTMVTEVALYLDSAVGSPEYQVSIQGDSNGLPNGVTMAGPATMECYAPSWQTVYFSNGGANLTAGTVYHIVVNPVLGYVNGTSWAVWRQGTVPGTQLYPNGQQVDPNMEIAQNLGSGWADVTGYEPLFVLVNSGNQPFDGVGYAVESDQEIYSGNTMGQRFVVNGTPMRVKTIGAYVRENGSPTVNLSWSIQNVATTITVASGIFATPSQVGSSYQWVDTPIPSTLLPVGVYRLVLSSTAAQGNDYQWSLGYSGNDSFMNGYMALSYGAGQFFGENSTNGTSWQTTFNGLYTHYDDDFGFRMQEDTSATLTPTPTATPVGAVVIGNQAVNGGYNDLVLDMGVSGSERFTSRATTMVTEVALYLDSAVGSPEYQVSIQGDSNGLPNGVTMAGPATMSLNSYSSGWVTTYFGNGAANLTAGTVYHIVVNLVSYSVNATNWAVWRRGDRGRCRGHSCTRTVSRWTRTWRSRRTWEADGWM